MLYLTIRRAKRLDLTQARQISKALWAGEGSHLLFVGGQVRVPRALVGVGVIVYFAVDLLRGTTSRCQPRPRLAKLRSTGNVVMGLQSVTN